MRDMAVDTQGFGLCPSSWLMNEPQRKWKKNGVQWVISSTCNRNPNQSPEPRTINSNIPANSHPYCFTYTTHSSTPPTLKSRVCKFSALQSPSFTALAQPPDTTYPRAVMTRTVKHTRPTRQFVAFASTQTNNHASQSDRHRP